MGSSRLPGKVLKPLMGKPLVGHIFDRLQAVEGLAGVVLATTIDPRNDPLVHYAERQGIPVHRASVEDDIAGRLAGACRLVDATAVLKVNADCPMIDPKVLGLILEAFLQNSQVDYVSNKIIWTWPEGMSAELIGRSAIEWCDKNLVSSEDRELVANWIRDNDSKFKVISVEGPRDLKNYKWSVDTLEDFREVESVFQELYPTNNLFGVEEILRHLIE